MAGISSTLSRKDLQFMAEDIGPELVAFLEPEDVMKGMNKKKQLRLLKAMFAKLAEEMGTENLLTELNPDIQQKFTEAASQKQVPNLSSNKAHSAK